MNNKIFSRVIALTILVSMIFTPAVSAAVTFTDISSHWAKDWIKKVADLGLVAGYKDGTFQPEKYVSVLESLVMMSRLYEIDEDIREEIVQQNTKAIKKMPNSEDYEWAYEELSIAIGLGIISEKSLSTFFQNKEINKNATREVIAVFLTKAIMLGDEAEKPSAYVIPFKDADKISDKAIPYIYMMYDTKIMTGDTDKKINPQANIKRCEMATVLYRAYEYIQANDIEPDFPDYVHTTTVTGVILDSDAQSYLEVLKDNGDKIVVRINNDTKVYLNGVSSKLSKIEKDLLVTAKIGEDLLAKTIDIDTQTNIVKGKISNVAYSSPAKLTIINEKGKKIEYKISSDVKTYLDGEEVEFRDLVRDDTISVRIKNDTVYQLNSTSRIKELKGKITAINYNYLPIKITMKTTDTEKDYTFEYSLSDVKITRNKADSSFDQIRIGDDVTMVTEYDELIQINTFVTESQMKGVIKEITHGQQARIKVTGVDGEVNEYTVNSNVKINLGSKNATIYDLRIGYQINFNTIGEEIVTIEAAEIQTAKSFSGKTIFVNYDDKIIMMQNIKDNGETELVYVKVVNSTKIFNTSGNTKYLKDIKEGDNILSTVISEGGEYVAVSIMLQ